MKKDVEAPNIGLIEKEYPYRYKWSSTIAMIVICGFVSYLAFQNALSEGGLLWWFSSIFMFVISLFGFYNAIINLTGKRRLIFTKDKIYLPQIYKSEKYNEVLFSEITDIELVDIYGNGTLRIFVKKKEYTIVHSWLPSLDVFNEILQHVSNKIKIHP